jgi:predicted nucleic acid binding AN1-type Zn finger protein
MELPHIGSQCGLDSCKQLDFLPFACESCGQTFCKDHYLDKDHPCDHSLVVEKTDNIAADCPLCQQLVVAQSGQDINQL